MKTHPYLCRRVPCRGVRVSDGALLWCVDPHPMTNKSCMTEIGLQNHYSVRARWNWAQKKKEVVEEEEEE